MPKVLTSRSYIYDYQDGSEASYGQPISLKEIQNLTDPLVHNLYLTYNF